MGTCRVSIESVSIALHHSRARGTAKLVLIGIANHDGDGGAWPSVATLARYANVTPRNVQKAVEQLESLREVRRVIQGGGDHRFAEHERPNRYEFLLRCPVDCDRSSRHKTAHHSPVALDLDPLSDSTPPVVSAIPPVSRPTPKPSFNPPKSKTSPVRHLPAARTRGTCQHGHDLVDDRHCTHGCPVKEFA